MESEYEPFDVKIPTSNLMEVYEPSIDYLR